MKWQTALGKYRIRITGIGNDQFSVNVGALSGGFFMKGPIQ